MGSEVTGFSIGDQVMGIVTSGAYAEFLTVHHRQVMVIPESLNMQQAAAIPEAWLTAYDALVDKGELQRHQTCLYTQVLQGWGQQQYKSPRD